MFKLARIRLTSRVASSECPPRAKKSSSTPTARDRDPGSRRTPRTATPPARCARRPAPAREAKSGAGNALRSNLPFTVNGSSSEHHHRRRHHVLRQRSPGDMRTHRHRIDPRLRVGRHNVRHQPRLPATSSRATTSGLAVTRVPPPPRPGPRPARSGTHGSSPGHRHGRRYSSSPCAFQRTRSPVRYIRSPAP